MTKFLVICLALVVAVGGCVALSQSEMIGNTEEHEDIKVVNTDEYIVIQQEYESVEQMNASFATDGVAEGGYVLINTGSVEDEDNAKLYVKRAKGYELVTDLSGATGERGMTGLNGSNGNTPYLKISDGTGMWEVSYDNGTTWTSLGVKAQGPQGEKGETGATGAQGPQGEKGDTGATGAQGPKGEKGDTGATGAQGPKGEKGDTGSAGTAGADGHDGITPQLRINGSTGMWEVSYDSGATWTSLGVKAQGPQGEKGDTGATGGSYELTDSDKQDIIDAVLKALNDDVSVRYIYGSNGWEVDSSGQYVYYCYYCDCSNCHARYYSIYNTDRPEDCLNCGSYIGGGENTWNPDYAG